MEMGRCCALFKVCAGYPGAGLVEYVFQLCRQIRVLPNLGQQVSLHLVKSKFRFPFGGVVRPFAVSFGLGQLDEQPPRLLNLLGEPPKTPPSVERIPPLQSVFPLVPKG